MNRSTGNAVDSKTVELRFENKQFEAGAKKSLSTIERLKNALNGTFVGKGLHNISSAASAGQKAVEGLNDAGSKISSAFDTVKTVAGMAMIADSAIKAKDAVTKFIKASTIDNVSAGWQKYADKTQAVQTIMSATRDLYSDQEKQLEDINAQLEKLNWFTDETSFNFTDMVDNIGKFTANQVALDDAVTAMEGISTWASTAGQTAAEAGHAMYNLSQAIGTGSVKLIDWHSIENANMATAEFKQHVIDTAVEMGTLKKNADGTLETLGEGMEVSVKNFTEGLKDAWFTSDVLISVLGDYGAFTEKLYGYMNEMDYDSASQVLSAIEDFQNGTINWTKAAEQAGVSAERLKEILSDLGSEEMEFSRNAFIMSQQATTFKQAVDSVGDAASTSWMNIFETIFGDYLVAKGLWTDLAETLYDVFVTPVNNLSDLLDNGFGGSSKATIEDLNSIVDNGLTSPLYLKKLRAAAEANGFVVDQITDDMQFLKAAVNSGALSVGDLKHAFETLGSGGTLVAENVNEDLKKQLEEGGEDIQAYIDKIKELDKNYTADDIMGIVFGNGTYDGQNKELEETMDSLMSALGLTQEQGDELRNVLIDMGALTDEYAKSITEMSLSELMALGYTKEQAVEIRRLAHDGKTLDEIMQRIGIDSQTGADHWLNGLNNLMEAVGLFMEIAGEEWSNVFPDIKGSDIFDLLAAFDDGTENLVDYLKTSETVRTVFHALAEAVSFVVQNLRLFGSALGGMALAKSAGLILKLVGGIAKFTGILLKAAVPFEFFKGFLEGITTNADGTANGIGKMVSKFIEWLKVLDPINKLLEGVRNLGRMAGLAMGGFFDRMMKSEKVKKAVDGLKKNWNTFYTGFSKHMNDGKGRIKKFSMEVERMGGIRLDNIGEVFKMAKDELADWIMSFPGVREGIENIKKIWEGFEDTLRDAGIPVDAIKEKISNFGDVFSTVFNWVKDLGGDAWKFMQDKWKTFVNLPVVQKNIERFKSAFDTAKTTFEDWATRLTSGWDKFTKKVEEIGGFKFENIGEIWDAFKEDVLGEFLDWDGFTAISDAFAGLWDDIKAQIKESTGFDIDGAWLGVKTFFEDLRDIFKDLGFPTSLNDIPQFIEDVGDAINNMDSEKTGTAADVFDLLKDVFKSIHGVIKFVVDNWKIFAAIGLIAILLKKLDLIVADVRARYQAVTKNIEATAKLKTAAAFALVVVALGWLVKTFIGLAKEFGGGWKAVGAILPALGAMIAIMWAMGRLFKTIGENKVKASEITGVALVIASFWVLAQAFKSLATMSLEDILKSLASFAIISLCMAGLMTVMGIVNKLGGEDAGKHMGNAFKGIAATIAAIAAAILVMALIPTKKLKIVVNHIKWILVLLALITGITGATKAKAGPLIALAFIIGLIGTVIALLATFVGVDNVKSICDSLTEVFVALAALMLAVGEVGKLPLSGLVVGLLGVAAVIAVIGAVCWALGALDKKFGIGENMLSGMDILCGMLGKVFSLIVETIGKLIETIKGALHFDKQEFQDFVDNIGYVAEKLGIESPFKEDSKSKIQKFADDLDYFAEILGSEKFKQNIEAIGNIDISWKGVGNLVALAILEAVGSLLGWFAGWASTVTAIEFDKSAVQLVADDLSYLAEKLGDPTFIGNYNRIAAISVTDQTSDNLKDLMVLEVFESAVGFISGIASIPSAIEFDKSAVQLVVDDLSYLATTLGDDNFKTSFEKIGNIEFSPQTQKNLSNFQDLEFITSINGFVAGLASIPTKWMFDRSATEQVISDVQAIATAFSDADFQSKMEAVGNLTLSETTISNLQNFNDMSFVMSITGFISGMTSVATELVEGKSSVEQVISDVQSIANAFSDGTFQKNIEDIGKPFINENVISNLQALNDADFVLSMTGFLSGMTSIVTELVEGKSSVEQVCDDMQKMATAFADTDFQANINSISELTIPSDKITAITTAVGDANFTGFISAFRDMIKPGEGDSMDSFTKDVRKLGTAIGIWVVQMDKLKNKDFTVPTEQIDALRTAIDSISKEGGLLGTISTFVTGTKDLDQFKTDAGKLGEALKAFVDGLGETDLDTLRTATTAMANLATVARSMQFIANNLDQIIGPFSSTVGEMGKAFNNLTSTINDPATVIAVAEAITPFMYALRSIVGLEFTGDIMNEDIVSSFDTNLTKIKDAVEKLVGMDDSGVTKLTSAIDSLGSAKLSNINAKAEGVTTGVDAGAAVADGIGSAGNKQAVSEAVGSLASSAMDSLDTGSFKNKGSDITKNIEAGIKEGSITDAVRDLVSSAKSAIDEYNDRFRDAGMYIVSGITRGIAQSQPVAVAAARALASATAAAIRITLAIHSPSEVTRRFGVFAGEGLALGLEDSAGRVYASGEMIANSAKDGIARSVGIINEMLSSDISPDPVIRPVLDLSEIQNGAGDISALLSAMKPIDPFGSFGVIGAAVEAKRKAASIDDVVSALGSVRESTSNIRGGDTYNVNGITYDDGSNITDAIKTLTHAVLTERRR